MKKSFSQWKSVLPALIFCLGVFTVRAQAPCTCSDNGCGWGSEMVKNGTFSASCFEDYFTGMRKVNCSDIGAAVHIGLTETNDAYNWFSVWKGKEHTGNGGRALLVDGPVYYNVPGEDRELKSQKAWYQNFQVKKGRDYCFSAWFKNICGGCNPGHAPEFSIRVNGVQIKSTGALVYDADENAWVKVCVKYRATFTGNAELAIVVLAQPDSDGNDAMIDDISFRQMNGPDADFSFSVPECNQPIRFTSRPQLVGNTTHSWNINPPGTSFTTANPGFNFTGLTGPLTVTHIVQSPCGNDTITKLITLPDCNNCCDSVKARLIAIPTPEAPRCCYKIEVSEIPCDVYGIVLDAPWNGQKITWPGKLQAPVVLGPFCSTPGVNTNLSFTLRFLGKCGDTVCVKTLTANCHPRDCCRDIMVQKIYKPMPGCVCGFTLMGSLLSPDPACAIGAVNITDLSAPGTGSVTAIYPIPSNTFQVSFPLADYCVNNLLIPGLYKAIRLGVQFYDGFGNLICTKIFEDTCWLLPHQGGGAIPLRTQTNRPEPETGRLRVFPNPAQTAVTLRLAGDGKPAAGKIQLQDMKGSVLLTRTTGIPPFQIQLNIQSLPPGTYIIRYIPDTGNEQRARFVKE